MAYLSLYNPFCDVEIHVDCVGRQIVLVGNMRGMEMKARNTRPRLIKYQEAPCAIDEFMFTKRAPTVSVVIPALNEAENLPHVLPRIPKWVYEVILVDGHSSDATVDVARRLWPGIRIVMQDGKGKGDAVRCGFAAANGKIVVMLDADGSTAPEEIPAFIAVLLAGADFAKGSRFLQGGGTADMPLYRQLGNWGFVLMVRAFFGGQYTDLCYGYNAFWRYVLAPLELDCNGFEVETMINVRALRLGLKIAEVPSFEDKRVYGEGRLRTIPDGWRVLKTIFAERLQELRRPADYERAIAD